MKIKCEPEELSRLMSIDDIAESLSKTSANIASIRSEMSMIQQRLLTIEQRLQDMTMTKPDENREG